MGTDSTRKTPPTPTPGTLSDPSDGPIPTPGTPQNEGKTGVEGSPGLSPRPVSERLATPARRRRKLSSATQVRRALADVVRKVEAGEMKPAAARAAISGLNAILRAIEAGDLEKGLRRIETSLERKGLLE